LTELLQFFTVASANGCVKESAVGELCDYTSLSAQTAASALARVAVYGPQKAKLQQDFLAKVQGVSNEVKIKGALCLGEYGKLVDLSGVPNVIDLVANLFKVANEEVRTAGSICLGNVSIGKPEFFLPRVFALVDNSDPQEKYLFLNTIREIIIHNSKCLELYLAKLLPLLVEHARSQDDMIRNLVAESIGRLFIFYSRLMSSEIESSFRSADALERSTIVKSFKYAAAKDADAFDLEQCVEQLLKLVQDSDLAVKRNALEALNAIVHNQPSCVRNDINQLHKMAVMETVVRPELITEVDLGPFKHKVDEGIPIRKAAYDLLDTMLEKIPERCDCSHIAEVAIKGLDDSAEECMIICLHVLGRLISWSPSIVVGNMDLLLESFEKQFQKNIKLISNSQSSEKAQNIMRAVLRVVEHLQRT